MARTKTVAPEALTALGAETLAKVLVAHAASDPVVRKKLGMLLVGIEGLGKRATEIEKWINMIGRSCSFVDRDRDKAFVQEFDLLRVTIATRRGEWDMARVIELLWEFVGITDAVMERIGDGILEVEGVFDAAMADLGRLSAAPATGDPKALARRVLAYFERESVGATDALIRHMSDARGAAGHAEIRQATEVALRAAPPAAGNHDGRADAHRRHLAFRLALLADLEHDADAPIVVIRAGGVEDIRALDVAERLSAADRPAEALDWLDRLRRRVEDEDEYEHKGDITAADLRIAALSERAHKALGTLAEIRATLDAAHARAEDPTKPAAADEIAVTIKPVGELTRIAEHEIHEAVPSCTRARRQMLAILPTRRAVLH